MLTNLNGDFKTGGHGVWIGVIFKVPILVFYKNCFIFSDKTTPIMIQKKKFVIVSLIVVTIAFLSQSFQNVQPRPPKKLKNIKAFPATMTYNEVDHQMDEFKVDLGVKCNYCHAPSKTEAPKLDMSLDDNPKKEIARNMIRMTLEMNQKYMSTLPHGDTTAVQTITCNTCHRGAAKPFGKLPEVKALVNGTR